MRSHLDSRKYISLQTKLNIFIVTIAALIATVAILISHTYGANQIDQYYKQCATDNATNFASTLNTDDVAKLKEVIISDEYQEIRQHAEEIESEQPVIKYMQEKGVYDIYINIRNSITKYIKNVKTIKYLYGIILFNKYDNYSMWLLDDESQPLWNLGGTDPREPELKGKDLTNLPEPQITTGSWGWLCTAFVTLYDSNNQPICIICCDVDMQNIMQERITYLVHGFIATAVCCLILLISAMRFIKRIITRPLNEINTQVKQFDPEDTNPKIIELSFKTNDEISDIYKSIRTMQTTTLKYLDDMSKLEKAKIFDDFKMEQLERQSLRDGLTSVGNKTAYLKKTKELAKGLHVNPNFKFAFIMIDINNLKQINDEFGHEKGDQYIINCCKIACDILKHSAVYRIGGDEFIAVLQGEDFINREHLFNKLRTTFRDTFMNKNKNLYERYSASTGMAENNEYLKNVDQVFEKADKEMYRNKTKFKEKYGSYR